MTNTHNKNTEEQWESGEFGASEEHVRKVSPEDERAVDEALGLHMISIRLQKKLIDDLKEMAKSEGISYQPLIRQVLTHYVHDNLQDHGKNRRLRATG